MATLWKRFTAVLAAMLLMSTLASAAFAFDDLGDIPEAASIMELKELGIVGGTGNGKFQPKAPITARDAIVLIVRGLDLSIEGDKQPSASELFDHVSDDDWFAGAFIAAHEHGVPIDRSIDPNASVTREQFVHWLMSAVDAKGPHAWIELYIMFEDEEDVTEGYMTSIQHALIAKIAKLDDSNKFRPKAEITRREAAEMVRNAMQFVRKVPPIEPLPDPIAEGEIKPSVEPVTEDISKIVLDMGERPHPGWGVKIESIVFVDEDTAIVQYSAVFPDPDGIYPMVITHPKAEAYIASSYTDIQYAYVPAANLTPAPDQPVISDPEPGMPEPAELPQSGETDGASAPASSGADADGETR